MKKIAVGLIAVFGLVLLQPASADVKPSIVIIDTGIDTQNSEIKDSIVYEVCAMETPRCLNGTRFQEGPGSATLSKSDMSIKGLDHGTVMALIAKQLNPNINIVFIRIVPTTSNGRIGSYTEQSVNHAMNWVINNKDKFNIVAVSASIGHNNFKTMTNYCPINPITRNNIISAQKIGIGSFFAAGNKYDYNRVDYPSCIPEAISVGGTEKTNRISLYSNGGLDLDFYALGDYNTSLARSVGSSASTVALASFWAKNYKGSYVDTYNYLKSITTPVANAKVKSNFFIDILK